MVKVGVGAAVEVLVLVLESVKVVVMVPSVPITIAGLAPVSGVGALKIRLNDLHGYSGFGHLVSPFYQALQRAPPAKRLGSHAQPWPAGRKRNAGGHI
jgi:hypothetical protein